MYSRYSALVGTMALSFQVLVLEPWHVRISKEVSELKELCRTITDDRHNVGHDRVGGPSKTATRW